MKLSALLFAAVLSTAFAAKAQTINFDDLKRPGKTVEKSWTLGGISSEAQGYIKQFGETDTSRIQTRRSSGSGGAWGEWVNVSFDVTCGFCATVDLTLKLSPADSNSSANFASDNGKRSTVGIFKGYGSQTIAGKYNYFVTWKRGGSTKACSGILPVSGSRQNVKFSVYEDCRSAGLSEF